MDGWEKVTTSECSTTLLFANIIWKVIQVKSALFHLLLMLFMDISYI